MTKPNVTTLCVRGFDALYVEVKAQAKWKGVLVKDWIERGLTRELARARKEQAPMETDLDSSS